MTDVNSKLKSADTVSLETQSQLQSQSINNQEIGLEDDFLVIGSDGSIDPMVEFHRPDANPRQRTQQKLDTKNRAIREQSLAIDTTEALQTQFRNKAQEYIKNLVRVNEKLVQIQVFEARSEPPLSNAERSLIKEKPSVLLRQTAIKKDIKLAQKQVDDAAKQLLKEKADLAAMKSDYDQCFNFAKEIGFESDLSVEIDGIEKQQKSLYPTLPDPACQPCYSASTNTTPLAGEKLTPSTNLPKYPIKPMQNDPLLISNDNGLSIDTQFSDGMLMPAFESKAVNQRSLKKMLQDLEGRLQWPITIEMDRELCALSEIQAALVTDHPQLEHYALLVKAIRNQLAANRAMLDRITIVQLEMRLVPMASRVAIKITLSSLSHNKGLKKELYKPAHFETRKKLFMTLQGEVKMDPSSNWKNPNKVISIRAAGPKGASRGRSGNFPQGGAGLGGTGYGNSRGRGRGRGRQSRFTARGGGYNQISSRPRQYFRGGRGGQENSRQRAGRLKLCFTCNRPGHQSKDCSARRASPQPLAS